MSAGASKNQRQHRITKLLESQAVTSQAQLVTLLGEEGFEATQTTVSRDLEDLGAVKVRLPGGETAYVLPELPVHQIAPEDHLRRVLGEWVVEVAHWGTWSYSVRRPARRTSSAPRWTAAGWRTSWAPWRVTTRCSWWSTSRWVASPWRRACATSRASACRRRHRGIEWEEHNGGHNGKDND